MAAPINSNAPGRFGRLKKYARAHKFVTTLIVIIVLGGAWWAYADAHKTPVETRYVMGTVSRSTLIASVSASGQVATTDSVDVKPQESGTITWVGIEAGQHVAAGQAIAAIDSSDAKQALADAKKQLATDQLTFQQSQAQAPVNYQNDQTALSNARETLQEDYNNTYNDLTAVYLNLPAVVTGANGAIYAFDYNTAKTQTNIDFLSNLFNDKDDTTSMTLFKGSSENDYATAKSQYDNALALYQGTPRTSETDKIDALLGTSVTMQTDVTQAVQTELNFYGAIADLSQEYDTALPSKFTTNQTNLRSYLSTANSDLSTLLADKKKIDTDKQAIQTDQQNISLDQVGNPNGDNPISLQVASNNIQKEEQDIAKQEADLDKYTVTAPFAGTVSTVSMHVGDSAGGSAVATIVSHQQIAQLSLNEVDAAKVAVGNKATLTFDAISGLTQTGTVAEIDSVGTVSQGVVSYTVKISFDTQDARVKPGMTVNADIQTAVKQDVLSVPSSAVKTTGDQSFVLAFDPPIASSTIAAAGAQGILSQIAPRQIPVVTGISSDTDVEIVSGLSEGQQIVDSTRTGSGSASSATSATSRTGAAAAGGARGFGGGGGVILR